MPGLSFATLGRQLRRLRYSVASTGLTRVFADVASHVLTYRPERDTSFDRRYGTDTAGRVDTGLLGIADPERQSQAILYLPSPARVTRWMLDNAGVDFRDFCFIDLGCGKGRVVLIASRYPFQQVLGVDLSASLTEIARRNLQVFPKRLQRCSAVRIHTGDAAQLEFPDGNIFLHLYHPFSPELTAALLSRLGESLAARPRRVFVAYLLYTGAVSEVRDVFGRFPWLRERRYEHSLLGNYDWLFFST
jgi:SAM-dependent methyltransferase